MQQHRLIILGSGPAGLTASIYAARAGLQPLVIHGLQPGGQMTITTDVENYPGFADVVQGPWLMEQMQKQADNVGVAFKNDIIKDVSLDAGLKTLTSETGEQYQTSALIISTGAQAQWLGLESELEFNGRGVSACATCDGFFYRKQRVCVVGGGNTAVEEALYLSNLAEHVTLIHRRDSLRAEKVLQQRLFDKPNIDIQWNSTVQKINGDPAPAGVTSITVQSTLDQTAIDIPVTGVFIAIGHKPETSMFINKLPLTPAGYIETAADSTATDIPGVYAAGDVTDDKYRQAVTAAGMGCMAALEAEQYLSTN